MKGQIVEVKRLDTGEVYPSITAAAAALYLTQSALSKLKSQGGTSCSGVPLQFRETGRAARRRPIRCVETGKVYPSTKAAADAIGVHPTSITYAARHCSTCHAYHWRYGRGSKTLTRKEEAK